MNTLFVASFYTTCGVLIEKGIEMTEFISFTVYCTNHFSIK